MNGVQEYGKALFLITEEDGISDKVIADVITAKSVFKENPEYVRLLDSPAIPKEERVALVDQAFVGLNEHLSSLIKILTEKRMIHLFDKVAEAYSALYDEARGILRVEAITAIPLTEEQSQTLSAKLEAKLGKKIILKNTVDSSILGGVKLRYNDVQLDGSVKTRLDKIEEAIKHPVI